MLLTSYFLAALAIALAWPTPLALSKAKWITRAPVQAVLLWQAIALGGGLSMIGSMLVWGLSPLGDNLISALHAGWRLLMGDPQVQYPGVVHLFALSTAFLFGFHLVLTLIRAAWRTSRQRAKHRQLLRLLSNPSETRPNTLVIDHDMPVAYCVPGISRSVTVLSRGLLTQLTPEEQQAVITHERSHLDQRHDLLILAFTAWNEALPWLPTSKLALEAVRQLIEMLADDKALEQVNRQTLLKAIVTVATAAAVDDASMIKSSSNAELVGMPGGEVSSRRLQRLLSPETALNKLARFLVLASTVLLLACPTILLVAPTLLAW
ncbi:MULTISPECIES: M56 family metallopeptidase [Micrococcaceae]|uniref:M56 family metallopeptidase n=1 Tax=Micrococcaceae TaxID=1268 RepID=UPI00103556E6|nr:MULTISPECIES: M56 family metallopeptidase [Micrococcaceae]TAP27620.1 M56 family peptidase [Arthrobacter sp. S41]UXN30711.1 M56 family metallopeptidase [Glutamicibacter sp. M10]